MLHSVTIIIFLGNSTDADRNIGALVGVSILCLVFLLTAVLGFVYLGFVVKSRLALKLELDELRRDRTEEQLVYEDIDQVQRDDNIIDTKQNISYVTVSQATEF